MKYNPTVVATFFHTQGLPPHVTEHRFAEGIVQYERKDGRMDTRRWAFDFAWLDHKVALEVEGGIYIGGGHSRGKGMRKDMDKYNNAALLGWRVLRVQPKQVYLLETAQMIRKMLYFVEQERNANRIKVD